MIEREWMRFESTGSISDYLNYKGHKNGIVQDTHMSGTEPEGRSRSVTEYGTGHSADRHGIISSSSRGI